MYSLFFFSYMWSNAGIYLKTQYIFRSFSLYIINLCKVFIHSFHFKTVKFIVKLLLSLSLSPFRLFLERQKNHFHIHSVACTGTEIHLAACPLEFNKPNSTSTCAGGMPAVVSCMPGPLFMQNSGLKKKPKTSVKWFFTLGTPNERLKFNLKEKRKVNIV